MSKNIIALLVLILPALLIITQTDQVYGATNETTSSDIDKIFNAIREYWLQVSIVAALITAGTSALVTTVNTYLKPKLEAKFKTRSLYTDPFANWCIQIHGSISEFGELVTKIHTDRRDINPHYDYGHRNPSFVITHLWEMHKAAEDGYKWLGMIEKINPARYKDFDDLFDAVDFLWHYLEEHYGFSTVKSSEGIQGILKKLGRHGRVLVANTVINAIYCGERFSNIIKPPIDSKSEIKIFQRMDEFLLKQISK